MSHLDQYRQMLDEQKERAGRPENPVLRDLELDPSARQLKDITPEERTLMARGSYYTIEPLLAPLTPLAMLTLVSTVLGILGVTDDELRDGFHGLEVDPMGEIRHIPSEQREELRRAQWHVLKAWRELGWPDGES